MADVKKNGRPWTPQTKLDAFIRCLHEGDGVNQAAKRAGVGRRTLYDHRAANPEFAEAWSEAVEHGTEALEKEAHRRAIEGSDTLIMFLLKARRPEMYRDRVSVEQRTEIVASADRLAKARGLAGDPELDAAIEKVAAAFADVATKDAGRSGNPSR